MMVITSPDLLIDNQQLKVFLAGSISGNTASNWQLQVIEALQNEKVIYVANNIQN